MSYATEMMNIVAAKTLTPSRTRASISCFTGRMPDHFTISESVLNGYEILVCDLKYDLTEFPVICVYRTPDSCVSASLQLVKAISDFSSTNVYTILMGDFNLPNLKSSCRSSVSKSFWEVFEARGLQQLVLALIRQCSGLDLLLCNRIGFVSKMQIGPLIETSDSSKYN